MHGVKVLENDFVLAMTGYHPDVDFLERIGVKLDVDTCVAQHNSQTLESNKKGIYLAGSIVAGKMTNQIFIETGRFHGSQIFDNLPSPDGRC